MTPDAIVRHFTDASGAYRFARWSRPIAPVAFGISDDTLSTLKGALEAVTATAGHRMAETDPETGANLVMFFVADWDELRGIPDIDTLLPGGAATIGRLEGGDAGSYRFFRFDGEGGGIRAVFAFVRVAGPRARMPAAEIALAEAAQAMLTWAADAFDGGSPLARTPGGLVLRPEVAALLRAAYDPVMPDAARDPSHALRLAARMSS